MRTTVAAYIAVALALVGLCRWGGLNAVQTVLIFAMSGAYVAALRFVERRRGPVTAEPEAEIGAELEPREAPPAPVVETRPWPRSVWVRRGSEPTR